MGFSCYTDYGTTPYGDLGPPESWQSVTLRKHGELIGDIQNKLVVLENALQDAQKEIERQAGIIERLQLKSWRGLEGAAK